jgi:hypothetical protein
MSTQGIIFIDLMGIGLLILILNLVRTKKLHVGYAVIWFLAIISLMVIISVPPLLNFLPRAVGAVFPASALSLLAFAFIFLVLIFFSMQLSVLSTRQARLIQSMALDELLRQQKNADRSSRDSDEHSPASPSNQGT